MIVFIIMRCRDRLVSFERERERERERGLIDVVVKEDSMLTDCVMIIR